MKQYLSEEGVRPHGLSHNNTWLVVLAISNTALFRILIGMVLYYFIIPHTSYADYGRRLLILDAETWHRAAIAAAQYWQGDMASVQFSYLEKYLGYITVMSIWYLATSSSEISVLFLNGLCFLGIGLCAWRLAIHLGQPPALAAGLAILVSIWPTTFPCSFVTMRNPVWILSIFLFLYCLASLLQAGRLSRRHWIAAGMGLVASAYLAANLRPYLGLHLHYLVLATGAVATVYSLRRKAKKMPARFLFLYPAALLASILAMQFPLSGLLPDSVHKNKAAYSIKTTPHTGEAGSSKILGPWNILMSYRWDFIQSGGNSRSPEAEEQLEKKIKMVHDPSFAARIIWAGVRDVWLFPFPWEVWPKQKSPIWIRMAISGTSLAWWLLLPGLIWGMASCFRNRPVVSATTLMWILGIGMVFGLVIVNRGTLYRFRDVIHLPMLLFFSPEPYRRLIQKARRR